MSLITFLRDKNMGKILPLHVFDMDKIPGDINKNLKQKGGEIMDDILQYHVQRSKKRLDAARGKSLRHFLNYLKTENANLNFEVEDESFRVLITVENPFVSRVRKNLSTTYCRLDDNLSQLFFEVVDPRTKEKIRFIYKLTEIVDEREYPDKDE